MQNQQDEQVSDPTSETATIFPTPKKITRTNEHTPKKKKKKGKKKEPAFPSTPWKKKNPTKPRSKSNHGRVNRRIGQEQAERRTTGSKKQRREGFTTGSGGAEGRRREDGAGLAARSGPSLGCPTSLAGSLALPPQLRRGMRGRIRRERGRRSFAAFYNSYTQEEEDIATQKK